MKIKFNDGTECGYCGGQMTVFKTVNYARCSEGLGCYSNMRDAARRILYKSKMSVFDETNLSLVDDMLEHEILTSLSKAFTLTEEDLTRLGVSEESRVAYKQRVDSLLRELTFAEFLEALKIPGLGEKECLRLMESSTYYDPSSEHNLQISIGRLLTHWEVHYGEIIRDCGEVKAELALHYLLPFKTKIEIQKMADLFIPYWATEQVLC